MTLSLGFSSFNKIEMQSSLFSHSIPRKDLYGLMRRIPNGLRTRKLRVHRNFGFEYIASVLSAFTSYSGFIVEFILSDYDDSLNFDTNGDVDLEMVWLDFSRYELDCEQLLSWFVDRVCKLRELSKAPILIGPDVQGFNKSAEFNRRLGDLIGQIPDVRLLRLDQLASDLGMDLYDTRLSQLAATMLTERANLEIARYLGLSIFPSFFRPAIKAVVFDLDNTLWDGVLGEDGIDGIRITESHRALHKRISEFIASGIYIGLLSRNNKDDVENVFITKTFPFNLTDISASEIGWHSKAKGMEAIVTSLRIGFDAVLFVDDNPGELADVALHCTGVEILLATSDPLQTVNALKYYPGLHRWGDDESDELRTKDLRSNFERDLLAKKLESQTEYLKSLGIALKASVNPRAELKRLVSLSHKTNQFNLSLSRLSELEVAEIMDRSIGVLCVGMWLKDKFSDSGLIGIMIVEANGTTMSVTELCISCRALGRRIESLMIGYGLIKAESVFKQRGLLIEKLAFKFKSGERNTPAKNWLESYACQSVDRDQAYVIDWYGEGVQKFLDSTPVLFLDDYINERTSN